VEQAHAHRLDPFGAEALGEAADLVGIDGMPHGAVGQDPLVDLEAEVARLRSVGVLFRTNDIVTGPGGTQVIIEDPSGNPIELFQPRR